MGGRQHCRLLIIDDQRVDREVYKRYLQRSTTYEFEFAEAVTAGAGIDLCRAWRPDCVLLDFNLPDMDGLDALPAMRREDNALSCAVVMLTAFGGEELAVNAMKSGAMDYLPKSQVGPDVLTHTVVNAIERFRLQRRIEEQRSALEGRTRQYQTLLEAIPQMVWTANTDGHIEFANRRWLAYAGLGAGLNGQLAWDEIIHPEDRERTWVAWNQARKSGSVFEIEHRMKRADDGGYRWHLVRALPFRDHEGGVTNWIGTCTEIENQKQAETINLKQQKLEGIGRLAAGIAHDFNNLLVTVLCGASYSMELLPPAHPALEMLRGVVRAGEQAAELTAKMLAYSGQGNLYVESADLNILVREACESLQRSIPTSIRLNINPGNDVPQLKTDLRQLRQLIVDLVKNSVEAIGGGAGTIEVTTGTADVEQVGDSGESGTNVVLDVADTGCGMDEETQKRIFDPFFTTKFAGRGLGLAAVHGFVRSNGGEVQVESTPGQGTRFRILLPSVPDAGSASAGLAASAYEGDPNIE
jgi:PAS domain S-box-containing protein